MALSLQAVLKWSAPGFSGGAASARAEMGALKTEAKATAGALDQAGRSTEKTAATLQAATATIRDLDRATEAATRRQSGFAAASQRWTEISQEAAKRQEADVQRHQQAAAYQGMLSKAIAETEAQQRKLAEASVKAANGSTAAGEAVRLTTHQMTNLSFQLNDVVTGLLSGQSPFMIMAQQGGQVTQAIGGVGRTVSLAGSVMRTALASPLVPLAALAVGIAAVAARAADLAAEARGFQVALKGMGRDAELTTGQLHDLVEEMRDAGLAKDTARQVVFTLVRQQQLPTDRIDRIGGLVADFAAGTGQAAEEAARQLAELGSKGAAAIAKLDEAYGLLTVSQARQIRALAEQGHQTEALDIALGALEDRFKGLARESMSPVERLTHNLGRAWGSFVDAVIDSGPVQAVISGLATAIAGIADTLDFFGGRSAPAKSTTQSFQDELDDIELHIAEFVARQNSAGLSMGESSKLAVLQSQAESLRRELDLLAEAAPPAAAPESKDPRDKFLAGQNTDLEKQRKLIGATATERVRLTARIEAEREAIERKLSEEQKAELVRIRVAQAMVEQASASSDLIRATLQEADAALAIADAYAVSTDAGKAEEAAQAARAEKLRNATVNEKALAEAIAKRAAAQSLTETVRAVKALDDQVAAARRLALASREGAAASAEAARQNDVEAFRKQALAAATADTIDQVLDQIAAYDAASKSLKAFNEEIEHNRQLQDLGDQLELTARELELVGATSREREVGLAILRKEQDLRRRGVDLTSDQAEAELKLTRQVAETRGTLEEANREKELWLEPIKNAIGGMQSAFTDLFETILSGGKNAFKNLGDSVLTLMKKVAAQIATLMVFRPILGGVLGSLGLTGVAQQLGLGSAAGATGAAGAASGGISIGTAGSFGSVGGILGALSAAASLGNVLLNGASWTAGAAGIGKAFASVGNFIGGADLAATFGNAGLQFSSPVGSIGSFAANFLLDRILGSGGVGSTIGQTIGAIAGSFLDLGLPGVGTILGSVAGNLLGRLFGGGKPANNSAGLDIELGTGARSNIHNGRDGANVAGRDALAGEVDRVRQQLLAVTGGAYGADKLNLAVGSRDGIQYTLKDATGAALGPTKYFKDAQEAFDAIMLDMAKTITGANELMQRAIANTTDGAKLFENLDFARTFEDKLTILSSGFGARDQQRFDAREQARAEFAKQAADFKTIADKTKEVFGERVITGYETRNRDEVSRTAVGHEGRGGGGVIFEETIRQVAERVPIYGEVSQEVARMDAALKKAALSLVGLASAGDAFAALTPQEPLQGMALAVQVLHDRIDAARPALEAVGFTAAQIQQIVATAQTQGMAQLRKGYLEGVDNQLLALQTPAAAAFKPMLDGFKDIIWSRDNLGFSGTEKAKLDTLVLEQTRAAIKGFSGEELADLKAYLEGITGAAPGAAAALGEVQAALAQQAADFNDAIRTRIRAARNAEGAQILDLYDQLQSDLADAATIGADQNLVREAFALDLVNAANARRVQTLQQEEQAAAAAAKAGADMARSWQRFRDSLAIGSQFGPFGAEERLVRSRSVVEDLYARAQGTGEDAEAARGQLQQALTDMLTASQAYNASSEDYYRDWERADEISRSMIATGQSIERQQLDLLTQIRDALRGSTSTAASQVNPNRNWGANPTRNRMLVDLVQAMTGQVYGGDFAAGQYQAWKTATLNAGQRAALDPVEAELVRTVNFAYGGVMTPFGALPLRRYDGGGVATSPQVALYAEGRRPEAYVPLPDGRSIPVTMTLPTAANDSGGGREVVRAIGAVGSDIQKLIRVVAIAGETHAGQLAEIKAQMVAMNRRLAILETAA